MGNLYEQIKLLRLKKGLSQQQLAEKINVTVSDIIKFETGESYPDVKTFIILADVFDVTIDYLLYGKNNPIREQIVMSNMELACKNDDINILNKLNGYVDEVGNNILTYIEKYESKKILEELASKTYNKNYNKLDFKKLVHLLLKYNMFEVLKNNKMLDYEFSSRGYRRVLVESLYYKPVNVGPGNSSADLEEYTYDLGNRKLFYDNWPTDGKIIEYFLEFKSLSKSEGNVKKKFKYENEIIYSDVDYSGLYYDLLMMAVKDSDVEKIKIIWEYAKKYNNLVDKIREKMRSLNIHILISYNSNINRADTLTYCSLSTTQVVNLLKMGLIDIAKEANHYAHKKQNWLNWIHEEVEDNQFIKYELIKNNKVDTIDTRIFDVKIGDIVVVNRVLNTKDPKFIVKTLKENPIFYSEYLYDLISKRKRREIFEFAVNNSISNLANATFNSNLDFESLKVVERFLEAEFGISGIEQKPYNVNFIKRKPFNDRYTFNRVLSRLKSINTYEKMYFEIGDFIKGIKEEKNAIIDKYESMIRANEMAMDAYSKDFFLSELKNKNHENCIIKLCTLFEIKLKAKGFDGELSKMIDDYCEQFYGDDGWGYKECKNKHLVDILNRLRMQRNNYLHADKKDIKELSKEDILECIDHICDMEMM